MFMKKNKNKIIFWLFFYVAINIFLVITYFVIYNNGSNQLIYFNGFKFKLRNLVIFIIVTAIPFELGHLIYLAFKKSKNKESVKNINSIKIKGFGNSKWMQNDLNDNKKTLAEFHLNYNCSNNNCSKKINVNPGFVFSTQYRNKKTNTLLIPPIQSKYEYFDIDLQEKVLDVQEFNKSLNRFKKILNNSIEDYDLTYHLKEKMHTIVLGATGSGKTQKLIFPGIIYNGSLEYNKKPTMIITDPKGEIHEATSGYLEKQGYDVFVLNYRKTSNSFSFNPLYTAWKYRRDAIMYEEENTKKAIFTRIDTVITFLKSGYVIFSNEKVFVKCGVHNIKDCEKCISDFQENLQNSFYETGEQISIFINKGNYYFEESEFNTIIDNEKRELKALSEKEIVSFGTIVIQNPNSGDPFWSDGARSYFIGIAITMLEIMDKNINAVPLEKFNIVNIIKMMNEDNMKEWYAKYKQDKILENEQSFGLEQASGTVNSADQTKQSLISSAKVALNQYSFSDIQGLLCGTKNMLDLEKIAYGEKPAAIYLIVPDDDKSLHGLVATFVDQLYKTCVKVATKNQMLGRTSSATLTRQIQFYLDEFGNFPKIPTFPEMITVSRSRNIFFMLILQDYKQLNEKYGQNDSATIKSNCNLNIYLKTNDVDTAKILENEYGKHAIANFGVSDNNTRAKIDIKNKNEQSGSIQSVPLISEEEIRNLDENLIIVKLVGKNPSLLNSLYSYNIQEYKEIMSLPKTSVPISSINFMKDHYFNFFTKDINQWKNYICEDEQEVVLQELLNMDIPINEIIDSNEKSDFEKLIILENEQKNIVNNFDIKSKYYKNHNNNFNKENVNLNNNKPKSVNSDLISKIKKLENQFLDQESLEMQIKYNYQKLQKIKNEYIEYKKLIPSELNEETKEKINLLYEEQKSISQNNLKLLQKMKESLN